LKRKQTSNKNSIAFSLHAACAILEGYGLAEEAMLAALRELIAKGKVENGYVRSDDLAAYAPKVVPACAHVLPLT
jgi:hypothetical protein